MEKGFYHPERGYWQTNTPPKQSTLETYPKGTVEVPLKPGPNHEWDEELKDWVFVEPPEMGPSNLSTPQFEWLLAYTGLGDVWNSVEKAALDSGDRETYATLKMERSRESFSLQKTLQMIEELSDLISSTAPDADVSETTIIEAWKKAELRS